MGIYYEGNKKVLFVGKGHMLSGPTTYRMWADAPSITMAGASGYGTNYEPNASLVLDWIQTKALYPSDSGTFELAYITKNGTMFNMNSYDYTGASHTSVALTTIPNNELSYRGSINPFRPWNDQQSLLTTLLPNHGVTHDNNHDPCFIGFSRKSSDSDKDYYIGGYSSLTITQRLLLATPDGSVPTVNHTICCGTTPSNISQPIMFFGMSIEDYIHPVQYINSNYSKRFTIPKDSANGIDTLYTLYEDTIVYPFGNYSAASVGPYVCVAAPGFSYGSSGIISGPDTMMTVVRGTLGISFS